MDLFCDAINRDSVPLFSFSFCIHVHIVRNLFSLSSEVSMFFSHYCFFQWNNSCLLFIFELFILLLLLSTVTNISLPELLSPHNFQSWQDLFHVLVFVTSSISTSSFGGMVLCIVIKFLILWSIFPLLSSLRRVQSIWSGSHYPDIYFFD